MATKRRKRKMQYTLKKNKTKGYKINMKIYKYNELSKKSKNKAIDNEIKYLISTVYCNKISKNLQKAFDVRSHSNLSFLVGKYCKHEIQKQLGYYNFIKNGDFYYKGKEIKLI